MLIAVESVRMASSAFVTLLQGSVARHPKPSPEHVYSYGTAGFRGDAAMLDRAVFTSGCIAGLRALSLSRGPAARVATGVMVTASHNPEKDNGVKLVEGHGDMLDQAWEADAARLANIADPEQFATELVAFATRLGVDLGASQEGRTVVVIIGRDTRPTGVSLAGSAREGAECFAALGGADVRVCDLGVVSTPILHYAVLKANATDPVAVAADVGSGAVEDAYNRMLAEGFEGFVRSHWGAGNSGGVASAGRMLVDGANGVGSQKLRNVIGVLQKFFDCHILDGVEVRNDGGPGGILNHQCGADHVQKEGLPVGFEPGTSIQGLRCASIDGDADRIVYFTYDNGFFLFDGDRIAVLAAILIRETLERCGLLEGTSIGVVQTAYANGASTAYLREVLKVETACTPTGVKHLHPVAKKFDVGIYFEANGHGTILFSDRLQERAATSEAASPFPHLVSMINQAVGDALSGLLLVEAAMLVKGWTIADWQKLYTELPSRQVKVTVPDRTKIKTVYDETRVTEPAALQSRIDVIVEQSGFRARAFVRPSGTEDVVRVYAEAENDAVAASLAEKICRAVREVVV